MGWFASLCCCWRQKPPDDEVIFPPGSLPSTSESDTFEQRGTMGKALSKVKSFFSSENVPTSDILPHEPPVDEQPYEPLASPRSPLIRGRGDLTPPDTPVLPPAKRLKSSELYVDFPFLQDNITIDYILRSKLMIILKGLPGSGKSTLAGNINKIYVNAVVCSADHFFIVDGEYRFNPQLLKDAHASCQDRAKNAAKRNTSVIVIDNTNIKNWESSHYLQISKKYHYVSMIVEPQTPWAFDAEELVKRNSHDINEEIILRKLKDYQEALPMYYAWFLNEPDSRMVSKIARQWLEKALLEVEDFFQDLSQIMMLNSPDDILEYFENGNVLLHTTSKFTNRGKNYQSREYIDDPTVYNALGMCYPLNIIGYVITPRTFGARIKLTDKELELWGANDYESAPNNMMNIPQFTGKQERNTNTTPDNEVSDLDNGFCICEPKIIIEPQDRTIPRFHPTSGKGSRAHLTLGTAQGVKPVTTGFDLMDVISCEQSEMANEELNENLMDIDSQINNSRTYDFNGAVIKCYGEGRWVIYPEDKVIVESLFSAFY